MSTLSFLILGIAAITVSVAIFKRPAVGSALILGLVHFERELMFNGISLVKLLSLVCIAIFIIRVLALRKGVRIDLTTWLIALFLLWVAITVFWSSDKSDILSEFISLILQSFMYLLIINLVRSKDDLKLTLWGHVIGGTVLAVILSIAMVKVNFVRSTEMEIAGLGINLAARMVGLNLLLAVILAQLEERRQVKIILIGIAIVSGIGSLLALSRGNWYALIMSAITFVFIMNIKKGVQYTFKQLFIMMSVGILAMIVANTYLFSDYGLSKLQDRAVSAITFSDGASGRFDIWRTAFDPFVEKPLFGHGFNSFKRLNEWKHTGAHNAFVLIAIEEGLIGLFLFCLILGNMFLGLLHQFTKQDANPIALGWGLALFVFLVTVCAVDSAVNRKYLWFVLGIISLLIYYFGKSETLEKTADEYKPVAQIEAANQFV